MRRQSVLLGIILWALFSILTFAQAPVPFINLPLIPDATPPGGSDFTLTVTGTGFVSGSVVNWNGTPLPTTFINNSRLTATVPGADLATPSTASVTVINSAPGGGSSNVAFFAVTPNVGMDVGFGMAFSPVVGAAAWAIAEGDFNGDGKLDLAADSSTLETISILLGDGTGNFSLASSTFPIFGLSMAVGDFNLDGKLDLAVATNPNTISVLLGDGSGNLTLVSSPPTGSGVWAVVAGDFNGDGKLDLAATNYTDATVSVLLGDGTGNFSLASSPNTGSYPGGLAVGDLNGDGKLDLAVVNLGGGVSILFGDGMGNFTLASSAPTETSPRAIVVGDFNADGNLDLAVSNYLSYSVSILLGDGAGHFTASSVPIGVEAYSLALGDFNGDSNLDVAVSNYQDNKVSILLGDGTGGFALLSVPAANEPHALALGDFNHDGKLDFAITEDFGSTAAIYLQDIPAVSLSSSSLAFEPLLLFRTSLPQGITLTNTSGVTLDITSIAATGDFTQVNKCGSSVAPGASCPINVTFKPTHVGSRTGTITITDNAANSPQTVTLTGSGTVVRLTPPYLSFGNQTVGTTSQPQIVTLANYSDRPVSILGYRFRHPNPQDFVQTNTCGASLSAKSTCTISISFAPKKVGSRQSFFDVNDDAGGSPQTVEVTGNGT